MLSRLFEIFYERKKKKKKKKELHIKIHYDRSAKSSQKFILVQWFGYHYSDFLGGLNYAV
jgi:hypothetical protein